VINAAAEEYRGVIPSAHWHEPYMSMAHLEREVADGVVFAGFQREGALIGVMGMQAVQDVTLIRHAYVLPEHQRWGVGAALLTHLLSSRTERVLVGTWADARWAIEFYERHGFVVAHEGLATELLARYWSIPKGQVDASVVLAKPPFNPGPHEHGDK
jgi:GNAT superfamily N-acetyltransferase